MRLATIIFSLLFINHAFAEDIRSTVSPTNKHTGATNNPIVEIQTRFGIIELELFSKKAPITVSNFIHYVNNGFYNNTTFHRVIPGFVIQGGGYNKYLEPKETLPAIQNESTENMPNLKGTVAMARTQHPDSATSQFYINLQNNHSLDAKPNRAGYTVFGKVISGMETINRITEIPTGHVEQFYNVPLEAVEITRALIKSSGATPIDYAPQQTATANNKSMYTSETLN